MTSLLDRCLERVPEGLPPGAALEQIRRKRGPGRGPEFKRIVALPRRRWEAVAAEYAVALTEELRRPGSTATLRPVQGAMIAEAILQRGLFAPVPVGQGKTYTASLLPTALGAVRPLLLGPAKLREATRRTLAAMAEDWRVHPGIRVESYEMLSRHPELLDELKPDLIVADEVHKLANATAAVTRRFGRYLRSVEGACVVCALSGSIAKRSIKDWASICGWALGVGAPVPLVWGELEDWSLALDPEVCPFSAMGPGALLDLCRSGETVHAGFRRRLVETPGVIAMGEADIGIDLRIERWDVVPPKNILTKIDTMVDTWTTPGGADIADPPELWRHVRELLQGFWYRWDPPAPAEWAEARRTWIRHVREVLKHNRRGLDTEGQVAAEARANVAAGVVEVEWLAWDAIRDSFVPNPVAVWEDLTVLRAAVEWAREVGGIVWTGSRAAGAALGRLGLEWFGGGDDRILDWRGPCAASIAAHGEGKNLQQWSRALVLEAPAAGRTWEQLLGRHHRPGQTAREVTFAVLLGCEQAESTMERALADARWIEEVHGTRQRLCSADLRLEAGKPPA